MFAKAEASRESKRNQRPEDANKNKYSGKQYTTAQVFLRNPYLYQGYKITLRLYLLVVQYKDRSLGLFYKDGKVNYTFKPYHLPKKPEGAENEDAEMQKSLLASGYHDNAHLFYEERKFPYTFLELCEHMREEGLNPEHDMISKIHQVLGDVVAASASRPSRNNKICNDLGMRCFDDSIRFQHFGVDVAVEADLKPYLLEVNKGPDMKLIRAELREGFFKSMWQAIGTHGPAPEWNTAAWSTPNFTIVYDSKYPSGPPKASHDEL